MTICVYSLDQPNFPLLCQFTTISNAAKLSCNAWANYVATVERDRPRGRRSDGRSHQTFARVYFNWQKASAGEAVRAVFAGHSKRNSETAATSHFLAVQLPLAFLPAGISSCPSTGNILVAGHKRLCLFRFCGRAAGDELNTSRSVLCRDFELIVDIDPGFSCIRGIALSDSFVAVRSYLEVRVIKLIFSSLDEAAQPKGSFVWEGDGRGSSSVTRWVSCTMLFAPSIHFFIYPSIHPFIQTTHNQFICKICIHSFIHPSFFLPFIHHSFIQSVIHSG